MGLIYNDQKGFLNEKFNIKEFQTPKHLFWVHKYHELVIKETYILVIR
jgi:hypothetical protein